ncbi:uncharacterized protein LOC18787191 isoform X4 [Prunus persica]|uniref:uncharacterized protein LOC18787191 isoform X4 n=1 Tax=Prunus persica TaxID=3760 RepID=UPI0009AB377A|nr:uncharacterized protein LOC18787191 isoform X4 [Prunus persica]
MKLLGLATYQWVGWMAGVVLRLVIKEFEGFSWTNCFSVPTVFVVSKERDGHCICLKVFVWFRPEQQINDEQLAYFSIHDRSFLSRRFQVLGVEEISCRCYWIFKSLLIWIPKVEKILTIII